VSRQIDIRPRADLDLDEYFLYIARDSEEAAIRFLQAAYDTFDEISRWPGLGRIHESTRSPVADIRWVAVTGFPNHLVFYYLPDDSTVRIVRIRHAAMDLAAIQFLEE
jgi:plasmid stabilization system protein ParE